jgi:hypothetical protein
MRMHATSNPRYAAGIELVSQVSNMFDEGGKIADNVFWSVSKYLRQY